MTIKQTIALCIFAIGTGVMAHRLNRHLDHLTNTDNLLEE